MLFFISILIVSGSFASSKTTGIRVDTQAVSISPQQSGSWSADFSTSNLDGWRFFGMNQTTINNGLHDSTYNITFGTPEDAVVNNSLNLKSGLSERTVAAHDSNIIVGTWSFDFIMYDANLVNVVSMQFTSGTKISKDMTGVPTGDSFSIAYNGYDWNFKLVEQKVNTMKHYDDSSLTQLYQKSMSPIKYDTPNHIDITRTSSGSISLYLNKSPMFGNVMDSNTLTLSSEVSFLTVGSTLYDNISVSDSILVDYSAPYFTHALEDMKTTQGNKFSYAINGTDNSGVVHYSVNNTDFQIDSNGVMTNAKELSAKTYHLGITLTDDFGNTATKGMTVKVDKKSILPFPLAGFVISFALIALIRRKRAENI